MGNVSSSDQSGDVSKLTGTPVDAAAPSGQHASTRSKNRRKAPATPRKHADGQDGSTSSREQREAPTAPRRSTRAHPQPIEQVTVGDRDVSTSTRKQRKAPIGPDPSTQTYPPPSYSSPMEGIETTAQEGSSLANGQQIPPKWPQRPWQYYSQTAEEAEEAALEGGDESTVGKKQKKKKRTPIAREKAVRFLPEPEPSVPSQPWRTSAEESSAPYQPTHNKRLPTATLKPALRSPPPRQRPYGRYRSNNSHSSASSQSHTSSIPLSDESDRDPRKELTRLTKNLNSTARLNNYLARKVEKMQVSSSDSDKGRKAAKVLHHIEKQGASYQREYDRFKARADANPVQRRRNGRKRPAKRTTSTPAKRKRDSGEVSGDSVSTHQPKRSRTIEPKPKNIEPVTQAPVVKSNESEPAMEDFHIMVTRRKVQKGAPPPPAIYGPQF